MAQPKSRDWLQIVGNLSVVAGLALVALQLNQSAHLMRAELGSSSYDRVLAANHMIVDGELAAVWAKTYEAPTELTLTEMVRLDGYLDSLVDNVEAEHWLLGLGIFEGSIEEMVSIYAGIISGNKFAMSWWLEAKSNYPPDLVAQFDRHINNAAHPVDIDRYRRIKSRLQ